MPATQYIRKVTPMKDDKLEMLILEYLSQNNGQAFKEDRLKSDLENRLDFRIDDEAFNAAVGRLLDKNEIFQTDGQVNISAGGNDRLKGADLKARIKKANEALVVLS